MPHTHYDNLKVSRDAPIEVIRASFLALSEKYAHSEDVLRVIDRAYAALSDPIRRAEHDKWIAEQDVRKEVPPASPQPETAPPAPEGKQSWTGWIGIGIVFVVLACIIVAMVVGPYLPQRNVTPDSAQTQIPSVPKADNSPSDLQPKIIEVPPVAKLKNPYRNDPSPKPSEQTPTSITQYRFVQAQSGGQPPRSDIDTVIQSGKYSALPPAEMVSPATGSGPSHLSIENQTGYTLTITFYTSAQRSITVEAGQTLEVDVEPGAYRELCRASSPTVPGR